MPSWQSNAISKAMRLFVNKAKVSSPEWTRAHAEKLSLRPSSYAPPKYLDKTTTLTVDHHNGWPQYEVSSKARPAERRVLYLHGGAYIEEILVFHWRLIAQLARQVPARVAVPVYPLAPRGQAAEVVPAVTGILAGMIDEAGSENVVLMGDSAGGGMALAAAQHLRDRYAVQPARTVLLSPWLDVTMTHPDQAPIAPRDPMLTRTGLAESGRLYAGPLDTTNPLVSPLYGRLDGLAPLTVFCGTRDLLLTETAAPWPTRPPSPESRSTTTRPTACSTSTRSCPSPKAARPAASSSTRADTSPPAHRRTHELGQEPHHQLALAPHSGEGQATNA